MVQNEQNKLLTAGVWGDLVDEAFGKRLPMGGVSVFGGEFSNIRSEVELSILKLLQLNREKGEEIQGQKLGIIGYGYRGNTLSVVAEQLGMEVYYYDTLIDQL